MHLRCCLCFILRPWGWELFQGTLLLSVLGSQKTFRWEIQGSSSLAVNLINLYRFLGELDHNFNNYFSVFISFGRIEPCHFGNVKSPSFFLILELKYSKSIFYLRVHSWYYAFYESGQILVGQKVHVSKKLYKNSNEIFGIMACTHCYSVIHNSFTALKSLCDLPVRSPRPPSRLLATTGLLLPSS